MTNSRFSKFEILVGNLLNNIFLHILLVVDSNDDFSVCSGVELNFKKINCSYFFLIFSKKTLRILLNIIILFKIKFILCAGLYYQENSIMKNRIKNLNSSRYNF